MMHRLAIPAVMSLCFAFVADAQVHSPSLLTGTRLRAQLQTSVSTKTSRVNDGVEAVLLKDVDSNGKVVLPPGSRLRGRIVDVRPADKKNKLHALLRLRFDQITLPDGRVLPTEASLQSLGLSQDVDSEGVATMPGISKGEAVAATATGGAVGAGVGAAAGGSKGAAVGAGVGAGVGALAALAEASARWQNFELKKGRKLWLRLDQDLAVPAK